MPDQKHPETPIEPTLKSLISSIYTAVLYNLGEIQIRGAAPVEKNLVIARFNYRLLKVLAAKTKGNLNDEELEFFSDVLKASEEIIQRHDPEHGSTSA